MKYKEILDYCTAEMKSKGADKSKCSLNLDEKRELYFNNGKISMFRTTYNAKLQLSAIIGDKLGTTSLNKLDKESIDSAVEKAISNSNASQPDPANDISEFQPAEDFTSGVMAPDNDKMYFRLNEFLTHVKSAYPITHFEEGGISYIRSNYFFRNSNGVDYSHDQGLYQFMTMFTSKKDKKMSSFNYTYKLMKGLDEKLIDIVNLKALLKQSAEEIDARPFNQKFEGDIIITPDCMGEMLSPMLGHLSDYSHITGSSLLKDSIGKKIASEKLTLRSNPLSDGFAVKSFFNDDGYKNVEMPIVENGVLKTFLLSLKGSKKTGKERALTDGSNMSVDAGDIKLADMIKNTKKGIMLARFSGGNPNDNGDFSGIAKNSYYIENGEIKYPVKEIMVSGNALKMLNDIEEISRETVDYGFCKYPWVKIKNITISGK
ncbi:MAG TPA: TldD/PmbA family protein [Clostridiales bacterium]|nr:TldD/PmbA family protein [Clostridiales bacterium]HQP69435.1 TldD/PmbA family protein [Clostridiales bacterium]